MGHILVVSFLFHQYLIYIIDYKLKRGNILSYLETIAERKITNKVEVSFTENKTEERQAVFILAGQNANYEADDAKVKVPANTLTNNEYWQIKYLTDYVNNLEKTPEVTAYIPNSDGTKTYIAYTDYELILDSDGGKVKFFNHFSVPADSPESRSWLFPQPLCPCPVSFDICIRGWCICIL